MIKTKNDSVVLSSQLETSQKGLLPSSYPAIYFYNKDNKTYNYIVNKNNQIVLITFMAGKEQETKQYLNIVDHSSFIWKNRKHINKSSKGVEMYSFHELFKTA